MDKSEYKLESFWLKISIIWLIYIFLYIPAANRSLKRICDKLSKYAIPNTDFSGICMDIMPDTTRSDLVIMLFITSAFCVLISYRIYVLSKKYKTLE